MIKEVAERVKPKQIILVVDDKVKSKLTREGYNPLFGARPLRRLVTKYVEDLISENILKSAPIKKSRTVKIILNEDDQIVVKPEELNPLLEGSSVSPSVRVKPLERKKQRTESKVSEEKVEPKVLPIKRRIELEE
jgi:hypothetical protein